MSKIRTASVQALFVVGAISIAAGFAWAAGDWSAAQSKVEVLKKQQKGLRELSADEMRRLVAAVCDVDEDEREQVAKDAASRVADKTKAALSDLERTRNEANSKIDEVLAETNLKDRFEDAKKLKDDLADRWKSIERMAANTMRGGNHPIIAHMSARGMQEHKDYQRNSSNCHAYEIDTARRRPDCLRADGDTCLVIELKPKNSRAIAKGEKQAREAAEDLNIELAKMAKGEGSEVMKKLINIKSDFAKCKRFDTKLKCYTLCPEVNDDADYTERGATWSDC